MFRTSVVAFGIVLASGGLALAQQSSSDSGPPNPPPKPAGHHHRPPPPGGPAALQDKGFDLQLGRGQGLRVQCGDEPLKSCIQAAQPLIHQLAQSSKRGGRGMSWKPRQQPMGPGSGTMNQGSGMMNQSRGMKQGSSDQQSPQSDSSDSQVQ